MVVATLSILCGAGCGGKPQAAERRRLTGKPDRSSAWQSTPLPSRAQSTAVKEGATPLVYLVDGGAVIRVHDANAKRDLARAFVPARSIVRVDARNGVIYGDESVLPGPLAADHRYVIFVDPTGENVARQGMVQPRPRGAR